jgi:hypothetical protein
MRKLTATLCLTVAVLLASVAEDVEANLCRFSKNTDPPTVIPSIEKLIKEKVISSKPSEILNGCVLSRVEL